MSSDLKIAVVHDWFISKGGAEKVIREILNCFPQADVFSLLNSFDDQLSKEIVHSKPIKASFLQKIPFAKKYHRYLFPLYVRAVESLDLSSYDLIISSSHAVAKGVKIQPNQIHICYCHTPVRYAWDLKEEYLKEVKQKLVKKLASWQLEKLRMWDLQVANRVNTYVANSQYISNRIQNNYNLNSTVIYPPIDTQFFQPNGIKVHERTNYLVVSRLVNYKRIDIVLDAFRKLPHLALKIVGTGPYEQRLKATAPPNVSFTGFIEDAELRREMQKSRALILTADEDFGITSLEAQACGIPVLALRKGGYLETVVEGKTGLFFKDQKAESLLEVIQQFEKNRLTFLPEAARENALKFSQEQFREKFLKLVKEKAQW